MSSRSLAIAALVSAVAFAAGAAFFYWKLAPEGPPGGGDTSGNVPGDGGGALAGRAGERERSGDAASPPADPGRGARRGGAPPVAPGPAGESPDAGDLATGEATAPAAGRLIVLVEDRDGAPVAGADVAATEGERSVGAATGADGVAEFPELPAASYQLRVSTPGFPALRSNERVRVTGGSVEEIVLVLGDHDQAITGTVRDSAGRPVAGIDVRVAPLERAAGRPMLVLETAAGGAAATSDAEGRFEVSGLAGGEYLLEVVAGEGHGSIRKNVVAPSYEVDLLLYEEAVLVVSGTVTDFEGTPIAGAEVSATTAIGIARTDEAGAYRLEARYRSGPGTPIVLTVTKRGYAVARETIPVEELEGGSIEVTFELEAIENLAALHGRLLGPEGDPVPGERIHLQSVGLGATYSASSDAQGKFEFTDIIAGDDYRLRIYPRQGYRDHRVEPFAVQPGENEVEIRLQRIEEGIVDGVLLDAGGAPLPRFTVRIRSTQSLAKTITAVTDQAGRFRAEGVPTGPLLIETRAFPRVSVRGLKLAAGEELPVEIPIGVGDHVIAGVVTSAGRPVAGARVVITWEKNLEGIRSTLFQDAVADESGRFTAAGFGAGPCSASVSAPGFLSEKVQFEVPRSGELPELEVELRPAGR